MSSKEQHLERIFNAFPQARFMQEAGERAIDARLANSEELSRVWLHELNEPTTLQTFDEPVGVLETSNLHEVRHINFWDYDDLFRDTAGSTMDLFGVAIRNEPEDRHQRLTYDGSADSGGIQTPKFTLREIVIGLMATGNVKSMHDIDQSRKSILDNVTYNGDRVLNYIVTAAQPGTELVTVQSAFEVFEGTMRGIAFTYNPDDSDEALGKKSDAMQYVYETVRDHGGVVDSVSFADDSPSHIYDFEENFVAKNGITKFIHRTPMHAMNRSSEKINYSRTASDAVADIINFVGVNIQPVEGGSNV